MTRWKITLEYEGSTFCGWQRQDNVRTVQQTVEEAVFSFSGESQTVHVSGRTDAGVHALAQVAHFDLEKEIEPHTLFGAINHYLRPYPVTLLKVEQMEASFHARFDAEARTYRYLILNRRAPSALWKNRAWHIHHPLDSEAMHEAAQCLLGKHDFSTFRASNCQANSPLRTLDSIGLSRDGEIIIMQTQARSFLYHQVRNMIGTLVLVGKGQWNKSDFEEAFKAKDRTKGGPTAPPDGLYFAGVRYDATTPDPSLCYPKEKL